MDIAEEMESKIAEITLSKESLKNGNKLVDLSFPPDSLVVMIKRDDNYFIPKGKTELMAGDKLLIIANNQKTIEETFGKLSANQ